MRARFRRIAFLMVLVVTFSLSMAPGPSAAWTLYQIEPSTTDANIDYESNSNNYHYVFIPSSPAQNRLAVFFPGTNAGGNAYDDKWGATMADYGYHVIILRYKNDTQTSGLCNRDNDPDCFRKYRHEVTYGEGVTAPDNSSYDSPHVSVDQANSAMNRLLKLVDYLANTSPYSSQGWDQFQDTGSYNSTYGAYNLVWDDVAAAGHSQGSGVALYLGKALSLGTIAMMSGPQDTKSGVTANWISEGGFTTSVNSIFGFTHTKESMYNDQVQAWDDLGLPGALTSVDGANPPYGNSHRLTTTAKPLSGCPIFGYYHNATVVDNCTPGNPPTFIPVWRHMADGP